MNMPVKSPRRSQRWEAIDFADIAPVACPCGSSRRAFADLTDYPLTVHQVEISVDARLHYHKRLTETYYILECGEEARLQLDDEIIPLRPGMCVVIKRGVRHRAMGRMTVLNIVVPKFDPEDEWFD